MSSQFFNQINFSASNEDERSELKAFESLHKPSILCITASGARPLSLLLTDPERIVAIDLNPTQNYLLELKMVAIKHYTHAEYLAFIGVSHLSGPQRTHAYRTLLRSALSHNAQVFWDAHEDAIAAGVIYCGMWEKLQKVMAQSLRLIGFPMQKLLQANSLEEQKQIWEKHGPKKRMNMLMAMLSWRWLWKYVFKEPGIDYVAEEFDISNYMLARLNHAIQHVYLRQSAFFWLMWTGQYQEALPVNLSAEHFAIIKQRIDRIEIVHDSLIDYLSHNDKTFDAFSLSDFSSYSDRQQNHRTWQAVVKSANHGAKVLARKFLVHHPLPHDIVERVTCDKALENHLEHTDDACLYSFICATVGADAAL